MPSYFPSPLDEENLALYVTTSQIYHKLHEKQCDHWLTISLFQSQYSLKASLEQICYERSQGIDVTSQQCLPFLTSKNKDLKQILKSATNVVLALKFLWTSNFSETKWLGFYMTETSIMKELKELLCVGLTGKSWKYIRQFSLKLYLRSSFFLYKA